MEEKKINSTEENLTITILKLQIKGYTVTKVTRKKFSNYYYEITYIKEQKTK